MMTIHNVLLLGATGETGGSILTGLLDARHFVRDSSHFSVLLLTNGQDVKALIRPSSAQKPEVKDLLKRGVKIVVADISSPVEELVPLLHGVDIFISAISGMALLEQMGIVTAARAGRHQALCSLCICDCLSCWRCDEVKGSSKS